MEHEKRDNMLYDTICIGNIFSHIKSIVIKVLGTKVKLLNSTRNMTNVDKTIINNVVLYMYIECICVGLNNQSKR